MTRTRWLVLALALAGAPTAAQDLVIYDDALRNGFLDYSYGGGTDFASAAPTRNGSPAAIAFTGADFNAIAFANEGADFATADYEGVRFWVHGGTAGGQQLAIQIYTGTGGIPVKTAPLDGYIAGGAIAANEWRLVEVRFAEPPLAFAGSFDRIDVQSDVAGGQPTLHVDDVALMAVPPDGTDLVHVDGFEGEDAPPVPGSLRFAAAGYAGAEGGGPIALTVERVGGADGAVGVTVSSSNGTAQAPGDYAALNATLNWADGEAGGKVVDLVPADDADDEGDETVQLALGSPSGGATLGTPAAATVTLVDDDLALPGNALVAARDVTGDAQLAYGCTGDRYTWRDAAGQPRDAFLAHNTGQTCPGNSRGGELRLLRFVLPGGATRTVRAPATGAGGFGYAVSHRQQGTTGIGTDDSPLGHRFTGQFQRVFEGRHHAIHRFTQLYPRHSRTTANPPNTRYDVPVTIEWLFATGRDHPLWTITWDLAGVPADALNDDARAPYGELLFDGSATPGAHAVIAGVGWGDRFRFVTTSSPLSYQSSWTWNVANTVPYVKLWTTAVDATMGTVQTQTIVQQDAGGYFGTNRWNTTSAAGNACTAAIGGVDTLMPCNFNWPYQSVNYSMDPFANPNGNTNNTRLAWGTNFGFLGRNQYPIHGSSAPEIGGPVAGDPVADGHPYQSYATFVVLGRHSDDAVGDQVAQIETVQGVTLAASTGAVVTEGPAGVARPDTETYDPPGWDPIRAAFRFTAADNALAATISVASGALVNPTIIVGDWSAGLPAQVTLGGEALVRDVDYFPSVNPATEELWITFDRTLAGPGTTLAIQP